MDIRISLEEIRSVLGDAQWAGQGPTEFTGVAGLEQARAGDLSFLSRSKYARLVPQSEASLILVPRDYEGEPRPGQWIVRVDHPSLALARLCAGIELRLRPRLAPGIHPAAVVDPTAMVDPSASIGPGTVIEAGAQIGPRAVIGPLVLIAHEARIGADSWIHSHVAVHRHVEIGERCILHSGVVLGADGFGFEPTPQGHFKVPQIGYVVIGDDVEIGANTTIDRGRFGPTRVGRGTKIDNLVQIGHNVVVGEHCFMCAQVGISGSTTIGDQVVLAGQAGIAGHLEIGSKSQIGAQSGVAKGFPPGTMVTGTPAAEFQKQRRLEALVRRLPQLFERVKMVELGLQTQVVEPD